MQYPLRRSEDEDPGRRESGLSLLVLHLMRRILSSLFTRLVVVLAFPCLTFVSSQLHAQSARHENEAHYAAVKAMLEQAEADIDLASVKLAIDQMIDPSIDSAAVLRQVNAITSDVRATFPPGATSLDKFKALRDYLHRPVPFSGRKAFVYNLDDDRNPRAKLLHVYLETHQGNCISMPLLMLIVAQKLGIPLAAATAPAHLYLKFHGDNGNWYGVEATNGGGWADDEWQKTQFPNLTPAAIANGIYMQPLTNREAAAVIAEALLEKYESEQNNVADEARVNMAILILKSYSKDVAAMVHAYWGYMGLRRRLFLDIYPQQSDIPVKLQPMYEMLERRGIYWGSKAKAFGFQPPTAAMEAGYRARIERARAERKSQP